jgi:hypothetical protein
MQEIIKILKSENLKYQIEGEKINVSLPKSIDHNGKEYTKIGKEKFCISVLPNEFRLYSSEGNWSRNGIVTQYDFFTQSIVLLEYFVKGQVLEAKSVLNKPRSAYHFGKVFHCLTDMEKGGGTLFNANMLNLEKRELKSIGIDIESTSSTEAEEAKSNTYEIKTELLIICEAFNLGSFIESISHSDEIDGYIQTKFKTSEGQFTHYYRVTK